MEEVLELVGLGPEELQVAAALGEAFRQPQELGLVLEDRHPVSPFPDPDPGGPAGGEGQKPFTLPEAL